MNILIPMAGSGSRFKKAGFEEPKPLIKINGKPMILRAVESLGLSKNFIFVIQKNKELKTLLEPIGKVIAIDFPTDGPACSSLLAKQYIDNDNPLVITNCDQILKWDANKFLTWLRLFEPDGAVVTYDSNRAHNSYARVSGAFVEEIREKEVISNISLNGVHYWRYGKDFVESVEEMINKKIMAANGEYYIAPSYNELIKRGAKIRYYHIPANQHWAVGTPEDLEEYLRYESTRT